MNRLARRRASAPLHRMIGVVVFVVLAGCSSSAPNTGDSKADAGANIEASGGSIAVGGGSDGAAPGSDTSTDLDGETTVGTNSRGDDGGPTGVYDGGEDSASGSSGSRASDASDGGGGGGASVTSCTKADAVCKADNTGCNVGSYYLYDNQWNCGGQFTCGPESAYGCTNSDGTVSWVTTSNQPKGNTAVLTYPAMQDNFKQPVLSSFSRISSTFTETSPGAIGDYEVAYDCWFNANNANELMVWVDTYKQVPAGNKVATYVPLGGHMYDVYWASGTGTNGTVSFESTTNFTSGTVDLLQIFEYAAQHGWLPMDSTIDQIDFGQEVCSTDGHDATWTVSDYSVVTK